MLTSIKPEKMNIKVFEEGILEALKQEGKEEVPLFGETTAPWKNPPGFGTEVSSTSSKAQAITGPIGSELQVNKWLWLNSGTRVRHALMSGNWRSKTTPGVLRSGGGSGKVVRVSKRIRRPGIKAREWTILIAKSRQKPFAVLMGNHIERATAKAF